MCNNCMVTVYTFNKKCPLCDSKVKGTKEGVDFINYDTVFLKVRKEKIIISIMGVFLGITALILIIVDFYFFHKTKIRWSLIIMGALLYLIIIVFDTLSGIKHIARRILNNYIALSCLLVIVDLITSNNRWSTNYVVPILGIVYTFLMTLIGIFKKSLWTEDIGYIQVMLLLNVVPILLFVFDLSTIFFPSIFSIIYSLLTILIFIIFFRKNFTNEIKKRFHW